MYVGFKMQAQFALNLLCNDFELECLRWSWADGLPSMSDAEESEVSSNPSLAGSTVITGESEHMMIQQPMNDKQFNEVNKNTTGCIIASDLTQNAVKVQIRHS